MFVELRDSRERGMSSRYSENTDATMQRYVDLMSKSNAFKHVDLNKTRVYIDSDLLCKYFPVPGGAVVGGFLVVDGWLYRVEVKEERIGGNMFVDEVAIMPRELGFQKAGATGVYRLGIVTGEEQFSQKASGVASSLRGRSRATGAVVGGASRGRGPRRVRVK